MTANASNRSQRAQTPRRAPSARWRMSLMVSLAAAASLALGLAGWMSDLASAGQGVPHERESATSSWSALTSSLSYHP